MFNNYYQFDATKLSHHINSASSSNTENRIKGWGVLVPASIEMKHFSRGYFCVIAQVILVAVLKRAMILPISQKKALYSEIQSCLRFSLELQPLLQQDDSMFEG